MVMRKVLRKLETGKTYCIDEVEGLADEVTCSIAVVHVQCVHEVLNQLVLTVDPVGLRTDHGTSHPICHHPDLSFFPVLPDPVRNVEENALKEEHEGHPLVVAVVSLLCLVVDVVPQPRMSHVRTHGFVQGIGKREGVGDPAVCVDHVFWDGSVVDAVDGVTCRKKPKG